MAEERPLPAVGWFERYFRDPHYQDRVRLLRGVPLLQNVSRRDMGVLMQSMFEKTYGEGELLFGEGDIGRALFIVASGSVDLIKRGVDGAPQLLASVEAGDFFGEMALLEEMPRSAGAMARTETSVYLLYRTKFFGLIRSRPRVGVAILDQLARLLSARLRVTSQRLVEQVEAQVE